MGLRLGKVYKMPELVYIKFKNVDGPDEVHHFDWTGANKEYFLIAVAIAFDNKMPKRSVFSAIVDFWIDDAE